MRNKEEKTPVLLYLPAVVDTAFLHESAEKTVSSGKTVTVPALIVAKLEALGAEQTPPDVEHGGDKVKRLVRVPASLHAAFAQQAAVLTKERGRTVTIPGLMAAILVANCSGVNDG